MEGKLIKEEEEYYALYTNKGIFVSDVNGGSLGNRLSLKNCEAIKNGYDLDELANEYANPDGDYDGYYGNSGFINGFRKALSILGDKKFSEEDVKKTLYLKNGFDKNGFSFYKSDEEIIQSLQQTEWDVEIEMEEDCPFDYTSRCTQGRCDCKKPKCDSNGCLILKRK